MCHSFKFMAEKFRLGLTVFVLLNNQGWSLENDKNHSSQSWKRFFWKKQELFIYFVVWHTRLKVFHKQTTIWPVLIVNNNKRPNYPNQYHLQLFIRAGINTWIINWLIHSKMSFWIVSQMCKPNISIVLVDIKKGSWDISIYFQKSPSYGNAGCARSRYTLKFLTADMPF